MGENRQKAIIALLIINAILVSYFGIIIKKQLNDKNHLVNQISNINNKVYNLEDRIANRIEWALKDRDNMVENVDYTYVNVEADKKKAVLDFSVDFKAVSPNSRIYLSYRTLEGPDTKEVELTKRESLSYGARIKMDLDKNYNYDFIERVDGGGEALLNVHTHAAYLYEEFYRNRVRMHSSGSSHNNERMEQNFTFSVNDFGADKFDIDRVILEVVYDNKLIDSLDVRDLIIPVDNSDLRDRYNVAVASGQIDPNMTLEEFREMLGSTITPEKSDGREYYHYNHRIVYDIDYSELNLSSQKVENLKLNLFVICKDGWKSY